MPRLTDQQQDERRSQILAAAYRCFTRDGFHRSSMQAICKEAGISPGGLYLYFPSKQALIGAMIEADRAELAAADYRAALHLMSPASPTWSPPVLTCSGLSGAGLPELWRQVEIHREKMSATGELDARRRTPQVRWMWSMLDDRLRDDLREDPEIDQVLASVEQRVHDGEIPATTAVDTIWERYLARRR